MRNLIVMIAVLILIAAQSVRAQKNSPPETLTLAQQQEDFKIFRGSLEEIHVGLNWFIDEKELNDLFDKTYKSLTDNTPVEDYYLKLRFIMGSLHHGHNGIYLPQEAGINYRLSSLSKSKKFLPFAIRILNNRIYVIVNCSSNEKLSAGAEIASINGEPVGKLLKKFLGLMFSNGRNTSFKIANLQDYYQFHYLYRLTHRDTNHFKIEAIQFGAKRKQSFEIEAEQPQTISERFQKITGKGISEYEGFLDYRVIDEKDKIAYLKIGTFYKGLAKNYAEFLDRSFSEIKRSGIEHLIVDVRQNEGGGDGYWQMAYVYSTGNSLTATAGLPYVKSDKFSYLKYVENPAPELTAFANNPSAIVDRMPDGRFRLKSELTAEDTKGYAAPPNAFSGKLYILQDGLTFSAGYAFVSTVHKELRNKKQFVKFIGEEPGDDPNSGVGSGGSSADVVLPNSRIKVHIPLLGGGDVLYPNSRKITIPDYKIVPTVKDLVSGTDAELRFTTDLIRKKYTSSSK